jgi:hypothetical protein
MREPTSLAPSLARTPRARSVNPKKVNSVFS